MLNEFFIIFLCLKIDVFLFFKIGEYKLITALLYWLYGISVLVVPPLCNAPLFNVLTLKEVIWSSLVKVAKLGLVWLYRLPDI